MDIHALQHWYELTKRDLPFRKTKNPYHIWVSEIMAQQTQMETVISYFVRYIEAYPTIQSLAEADEAALHKLFEGIGYYRRFQHMQKAAKYIMAELNGQFPTTYEEVRKLPGVGDYTAGAIMSIAFNQPYAATDGNVIRVLSRYYGIAEDMKDEKSRKKIDALNQQEIHRSTPQVYTQALMELGALVCKKNQPSCPSCPICEACYANIHNQTSDFPVISRKKAVITRHFITVVLLHNDEVALIRTEQGLLKGMYLYPQYEDKTFEEVLNELSKDGCQITHTNYTNTYKHQFTHQRWEMKVYQIHTKVKGTNSSLVWTHATEDFPMAIAHRKILVK